MKDFGFRERARRQHATQSWKVGDVVRVGFVSCLKVLEKIESPEAYVLQGQNTGTIYRFQPHRGIIKCASVAEARRAE